jgi:hypothetical protein
MLLRLRLGILMLIWTALLTRFVLVVFPGFRWPP